MKTYAVRLIRGQDLKKEIENYCRSLKIDTAVVLSSVGCLYEYKIRMAKALSTIEEVKDVEILCLNGTISKGNAHIHIAVSDETGVCTGGHLLDGCLVNTTCELVLLEIDQKSERLFDDATGYDEICFESEEV